MLRKLYNYFERQFKQGVHWLEDRQLVVTLLKNIIVAK